MAKRKDSTEERIVAVEEALSKSEQFIERNQKILTIVVAAIVLIVLVVIGYRKFIVQPKEKNAASAMFMAERYFEKDSFNLALHGDGYYPGFLEIIDDYGITESAELAEYYAGISYMHLGDYESAAEYLEKYSGDDQIVSSMALGALGDAYIEMGDLEKGVDHYVKAAKTNQNDFISPPFLMKAGWGYELMDEWDRALDMYETIKEEYPKSRESANIEKFIARAKAKIGEE